MTRQERIKKLAKSVETELRSLGTYSERDITWMVDNHVKTLRTLSTKKLEGIPLT